MVQASSRINLHTPWHLPAELVHVFRPPIELQSNRIFQASCPIKILPFVLLLLNLFIQPSFQQSSCLAGQKGQCKSLGQAHVLPSPGKLHEGNLLPQGAFRGSPYPSPIQPIHPVIYSSYIRRPSFQISGVCSWERHSILLVNLSSAQGFSMSCLQN